MQARLLIGCTAAIANVAPREVLTHRKWTSLYTARSGLPLGDRQGTGGKLDSLAERLHQGGRAATAAPGLPCDVEELVEDLSPPGTPGT